MKTLACIHLREVAFDLNDSGWTREAIHRLSDVLRDFPDVFSRSPLLFRETGMFGSGPRHDTAGLASIQAQPFGREKGP